MLLALSAIVVSCANLNLKLLDHPAVHFKPDVFLLELFLQLSPVGLCVADLVPL